jgi:hypothetical protein
LVVGVRNEWIRGGAGVMSDSSWKGPSGLGYTRNPDRGQGDTVDDFILIGPHLSGALEEVGVYVS